MEFRFGRCSSSVGRLVLGSFSDPSTNQQRFDQAPLVTTRNILHQIIKTMNIQISFTPDGIAHCLWTDAISLHELGRLEITRASNIDFNNSDQQWEVQDRKGRIRFFSKSRSDCLEWEQQNLQPE
jgi:hypothetical protein